jgi:transposase, IS5 family
MTHKDLSEVMVDTTVQAKAVMFPTAAKLVHRAHKSLRKLKTYLGYTLRDFGRQIKDNSALQEVFKIPLYLGNRVMTQKKRKEKATEGRKVYSLHAPAVE